MFVVFVGVCLEPAVLGLLESKGESVKGFVRTQPDKAAVAHIDIGLKAVGVAAAYAAVQTVAGNHQIGLVLLCQRLVVCHVVFENQIHAQLFAALLQDIEQVLAAYAAKAVAGGAHAAAFEKHLDVVPVVEGVAYQPGRVRVRLAQVVQRLVAQHHAPAKGVIGSVAFDHGDAVQGILLLHQQREIQTGGATAYAQYVHTHIVEV